MTLKPITTPTLTYTWQPRPINVWVTGEPYNHLQVHILRELRKRLEGRGCIFVEQPAQATPLGPVAHLGIAFGKDLDEEISPLDRVGRMPKPRGMMLIVNTVAQIPHQPLFDLGRGQIVKKAGHVSVMVEGDLNGETIHRALWASMPGNNFLLTGDADSILDGIALRVQAHASADKVSQNVGERQADYIWSQWSESDAHADIAYAARALGEVGIIEDEVPLAHFASSKQIRSILSFLKRAAMGEGMRSQLDLDLGVMGVTTSGGNKVNVSDDPHDGHVIPITELAWDGYVQDIPQGCPVSFTTPSVETHENGLVYLASALINSGLIDSFDGFISYLHDHFARHERVRIIPDGLRPAVTAIDHFHRQPIMSTIKEPERIEIVYPDTEHFPEIDFPCGVREAEYHLLSALFKSEWFTTPGDLGQRVIWAVLPGHGSVVLYGGPRHELTDLLVNGMEMEEIVRI